MEPVHIAAIVYVVLCLIFGYTHWRIIKRDERKEAERLKAKKPCDSKGEDH